MEFTKSLIKGKLIKRYKRFFVDVKINKEVVTAHCPNTGSMKGLLAAVLDLPDSSMFNFVIDNCSVSVIGIHPTGEEPNVLALLNQTTHLEA